MAVQAEDDCLIKDVSGVRNEVLKVFMGGFKESMEVRSEMNNACFKRLNEVDRNFLEVEFSREEVRMAVWESEGNKSPGPDGFNFKFLQE